RVLPPFLLGLISNSGVWSLNSICSRVSYTCTISLTTLSSVLLSSTSLISFGLIKFYASRMLDAGSALCERLDAALLRMRKLRCEDFERCRGHTAPTGRRPGLAECGRADRPTRPLPGAGRASGIVISINCPANGHTQELPESSRGL